MTKTGACILLSLTCIALAGCGDDDDPSAVLDPDPVPVLTPDPVWQLQLHHSNITSMTAADANHIWISILDHGIRRSVDGGATWTDLGHPGARGAGRIKFVSPTHGWMLHDSVIYSTSNGGESWDMRLDSSWPHQGTLYSTSFVSAGTAWVAHKGYGLPYRRTTDGGATWTLTNPAPGTSPRLMFLDDRNGLVTLKSGSLDKVFATRNGGETWQEILKSDAYLSAFTALDRDRIWVAIHDQYTPSSQLRRTSDGGATWTTVELKMNSISSIEFIDAAHGWLTTYDKIYRTQDGGATWTAQKTVLEIPDEPYGVFGFSRLDFVGARTGWVMGYHGTSIYHTSNFLMKATAEEE